ncbi:MAG TPA: NYN domain-containing protein [Acidimicrobiales bacterium]|nr:NYN domain-containing protein [Acidimicrobiales bacterium]
MRGALEAAWLVAKAGERSAPPVPAPRPLRPLLGHARLMPAALATIRRVLDDDAAFRSLVAAAVDEDAVGRAGWLFLARPEGWEDELAALTSAASEAAAAAGVDRDERAAVRRLRGAEEALRRAEEALEEVRASAARAADELARERAARRDVEAEAARLAERVRSLEAALASARARVAELEARPAAVVEVVPVVPPAAAEALDRAAAAVRTADAALADAVEVVTSFVPAEAPPAAATAPRPARPARAARAARRKPAPLPPAVFEDSAEAAEHLVRVPGALLLVDGYNASLAYRPDLPIPELRRRLVDAVDELVVRTGVEAHVVFDGADVDDDRPERTGGRRRSARVLFSPPDVEADDVILRLAEAAPVTRVVVVASNDRRVQDGARELGANVISSTQLLAALRREP